MKQDFLELIRRTSTTLPQDVSRALAAASRREEAGAAKSALKEILANCERAAQTSRPLCQDTGTNIWYVYHPVEITQTEIKRQIIAATKAATAKAFLRPNAVDPITGVNSGDNTGVGAPVIHFHQWNKKSLVADLLLKGGGSENVSACYSLPHIKLGAGRDLEGVRKVVLDGVFHAQGKGCGPGIIGVGVGGDRATSMLEAKEQLFRHLTDHNPNKTLDKLERRLLKELNQLEIGPMGFGGATTALGVKIGTRHRLPAGYFVSIAYMCWAARRSSVSIDARGARYGELSQIAKSYDLPAGGRDTLKGKQS